MASVYLRLGGREAIHTTKGVGQGNGARLPRRLRHCRTCNEDGHDRRTCPLEREVKTSGRVAPPPASGPAPVTCDDRFLVVEDCVDLAGAHSSSTVYWTADEEWRPADPTGRVVGGHREWRLCHLDGREQLGFPTLYPFQRRPTAKGPREIPRLGMWPGTPACPVDLGEAA